MDRVLPVVVVDALVLGDNDLPYITDHTNSRVDGTNKNLPVLLGAKFLFQLNDLLDSCLR